jgi:hypothetical protein
MARARNIKPGFFTNDLLAEVPPLGRILFAGLWTIADRSGRLEDRPKKIKAEILPFDNCNVDKLLNELAKRSFIQRYEIDGVRYIQIVTWNKHQNPHIKEAESTIPAPCKTPDKHSASTVQEPDETQPIPERARLIPDSLNLIPDSSVPESGADAPPRAARSPGKFLMWPDWKPDQEILTGLCVRAGVLPGIVTQAVIAEFSQHWSDEQAVNTEGQWCQKLLASARRVAAQQHAPSGSRKQGQSLDEIMATLRAGLPPEEDEHEQSA